MQSLRNQLKMQFGLLGKRMSLYCNADGQVSSVCRMSNDLIERIELLLLFVFN